MANEFVGVCSPSLGAMSGRLQPSGWTAPDGSYVLCLGADRDDAVVDAHAGHRLGINGVWPTGFAGGETLQIAVDGGGTQTVTFAATDQTLALVVAAINTQITGATASDVDDELKIESDTIGYDSTLQVVGGTGMVQLGHVAATGNGYGGLQIGDYCGWKQTGVNFAAVTVLAFGLRFKQPTNTGIKFKLSVLVGGAPLYTATPLAGETLDGATRRVNVSGVAGVADLEFRLEVVA